MKTKIGHKYFREKCHLSYRLPLSISSSTMYLNKIYTGYIGVQRLSNLSLYGLQNICFYVVQGKRTSDRHMYRSTIKIQSHLYVVVSDRLGILYIMLFNLSISNDFITSNMYMPVF